MNDVHKTIEAVWRIESTRLIAALNRAVAVGMAQGPAAGLAAVDAITMHEADSALARYHLFHSVRGDLLMKMGCLPEAREETQRAIALTRNLREQEPLAGRLKQMDDRGQ